MKNKHSFSEVQRRDLPGKRIPSEYMPRNRKQVSLVYPRIVQNDAAAIRVEHLMKRFGEAVAVDSIDFEVKKGDTCALLGGNGAGKSTIIAMLLGLLTPTSGRVHVMGIDMLTDRYRALPKMNFSSPYVDLPKRDNGP